MQALKNRGCFITPAGPNEGIAVDASSSHAEVNKQLIQWFPHVFGYIAEARKQEARVSNSKQSSERPEWRVLVRSGSTFSIVEVVQPNGSTLYENKGRGKAGSSESELWFGKSSKFNNHDGVIG